MFLLLCLVYLAFSILLKCFTFLFIYVSFIIWHTLTSFLLNIFSDAWLKCVYLCTLHCIWKNIYKEWIKTHANIYKNPFDIVFWLCFGCFFTVVKYIANKVKDRDFHISIWKCFGPEKTIIISLRALWMWDIFVFLLIFFVLPLLSSLFNIWKHK